MPAAARKRGPVRLDPSRIDPYALIDALPQLVWIVDESANVLYFNARWCEYTGLTLEESLGGGWVDALHPEDLERTKAAWRHVFATGEPLDIEYRLRAADGSYREMLGRGVPVRDEAGRIVQWVGTLTDIHELKRVEATLSLLSQASDALAQSLDLQRTLDVLLELVIPAYGDWGLISVRDDDGGIRAAAVRHANPALAGEAEKLRGQIYHVSNTEVGSPGVYLSGEAQIIEHAQIELAKVIKPEFVAVHERLGMGWGLSVPIAIAGSVIGTLGVVSVGTRRSYSESDLSILQELAARAGYAISNANRFARQYRAAYALQKGALPASLPSVPGVDLQGYYAVAAGDAFVGGDWYDAVRLDDGRVVISIGDVSGNGLGAAVTMAGVRQLFRAAAHIELDPAAILAAADRALRSENPDCYVTAFVGIIDTATFSFRYANAGHPPPLVRRPDGAIEELEGGLGLPLGLRTPGTSRPTAVAALLPGTLLVLYTDGLIEATRDGIAGLDRLKVVLADAPAFGESPNVALDIAAATLQDATANDDVAILTLALAPQASADRDDDETLARWSFEGGDAAAIARVRQAFVRRFATIGCSRDDAIAALTVFGELVANAVSHGAGKVEIVLDTAGKLPVLHVLDRGPSFTCEALVPPDPLAESGRGLYIVAQLARDFRVAPRHDGGTHARATLALERYQKSRL